MAEHKGERVHRATTDPSGTTINHEVICFPPSREGLGPVFFPVVKDFKLTAVLSGVVRELCHENFDH